MLSWENQRVEVSRISRLANPCTPLLYVDDSGAEIAYFISGYEGLQQCSNDNSSQYRQPHIHRRRSRRTAARNIRLGAGSISPSTRTLVVKHLATILQRIPHEDKVLSDSTSILGNLNLCRGARLHNIPEITGRCIRLVFVWRSDRDES